MAVDISTKLNLDTNDDTIFNFVTYDLLFNRQCLKKYSFSF